MSKQKNEIVVSGGIGFLPALCLIFITLKLCNVIDWSWWWVLAPIWIPIAAVIAILLIVCIVWGIASLFDR